MPAYPRSYYVREGEIGTFHAWSRCVQRAFLCGDDPYTGQNFDYRRDWIEQLFKYQAAVFAVDLCNYNILSNHEHLIVRTRPDITLGWSDEEVAWRWKMAWPTWIDGQGWICRPSDEEIRRLLADAAKLLQIRINLSSLSWFMARVKQPIAEMANAEMHCKGHYFEQRFACRPLRDLPAELTCSVYVDVNQTLAQLAESLELSRCSAIRLRLNDWRDVEVRLSLEQFNTEDRPDSRLEQSEMESLLDGSFLSPISDRGPLLNVGDLGTLTTAESAELVIAHETSTENSEPKEQLAETEGTSHFLTEVAETSHSEAESLSNDHKKPGQRVEPSKERTSIRLSRERSALPPTFEIHHRQKSQQRPRASDQVFLGIPAEQYREIVVWTAARITCFGSNEEMPAEISTALQRAGVRPEAWLTMMTAFEKMFRVAVGTVESVKLLLQRHQRERFHGIRACRSSFT